jgi:glucokinase
VSGAPLLGIDVGGTKTALALIDAETGAIGARRTIPTPRPERSGEAFLDEVATAARELVAGGPILARGIGLCELVAPGGSVESGHRVRWQGLPVRDRLAAVVTSDVHAAALAEARLGAGRAFASFLYVNIGTGLSSALVLGGQIHRGANGHALVLASSPTAFRCPACGERHEQVLEDIAGGAALAAQNGPTAIADAAAALGSTLATILGAIDPEALVIGGGLGSAEGPYMQALCREIRARIWSERTRALPILKAALGPDAGVVGAALAALQTFSPSTASISSARLKGSDGGPRML